MTVRLWDLQNPIRVWDHHTEFSKGIDWSLQIKNKIASTSWDQRVYIWNIEQGAPMPGNIN